MYVTGTVTTFNHRVHQLATGAADLDKYEIEAYNYTGILKSNDILLTAQRLFQNSASSITRTGYKSDIFFTGVYYF